MYWVFSSSRVSGPLGFLLMISWKFKFHCCVIWGHQKLLSLNHKWWHYDYCVALHLARLALKSVISCVLLCVIVRVCKMTCKRVSHGSWNTVEPRYNAVVGSHTWWTALTEGRVITRFDCIPASVRDSLTCHFANSNNYT